MGKRARVKHITARDHITLQIAEQRALLAVLGSDDIHLYERAVARLRRYEAQRRHAGRSSGERRHENAPRQNQSFDAWARALLRTYPGRPIREIAAEQLRRAQREPVLNSWHARLANQRKNRRSPSTKPAIDLDIAALAARLRKLKHHN